MKEIVANVDLPYAGKNRRAGDKFEAKDEDARVLVMLRRARYPDQADQAPKAKAKRYRRRDMRAAS